MNSGAPEGLAVHATRHPLSSMVILWITQDYTNISIRYFGKHEQSILYTMGASSGAGTA